MPPVPADLILGQTLALRIVAAGRGRVRRVTMVGSRALGIARAGSDLDLVVLVEPPAARPHWTSGDVLGEKQRLQQAVGPPPVPTDLWLRTTDQFAEARDVFGTVEWMIGSEGVDLYASARERPPVVRRTPDQVRRQSVRAWLMDAAIQLDRALRLSTTPGKGRNGAFTEHDPAHYAWRSAQRVIVALFVYHQVPVSTRREELGSVFSRLDLIEPAVAAGLRRLLPTSSASPQAARAVHERVMGRLRRDPAMRPYLKEVRFP